MWSTTNQFCSGLSNIHRWHLNYGKWGIMLSAHRKTVFYCQQIDPNEGSREALSKCFLLSPQSLSVLTPRRVAHARQLSRRCHPGQLLHPPLPPRLIVQHHHDHNRLFVMLFSCHVSADQGSGQAEQGTPMLCRGKLFALYPFLGGTLLFG